MFDNGRLPAALHVTRGSVYICRSPPILNFPRVGYVVILLSTLTFNSFIRPFSMNSWFFFFLFFFFLRGGDVRDPFFLLLFYFLKLIYLFISPFALLKYDTKRNLMFYQSISVKHRLSVLCFDNIRVDVDNYFLCLVTAV